MYKWIAFFRGINVGGNNIIAMKELVALLEEIGCLKARTYVQSGNVVFQNREIKAEKLATHIASAIAQNHGFSPRVVLLKANELEKATLRNPFPKAESRPKSLHLWFLTAKPKSPDFDALNKIKAPKESFVLDGKIFYLHAPDGIGKSKLAARVENSLGVAATARNWNTVTALLKLTRE